MVVLPVVVMPLLLAVYGDMDMQALYAALGIPLGGDEGLSREGGVHLPQECRLLRFTQQIQQGPGQHIARDAHAAVYVQCSHLLLSLGIGSRLTAE